jgi:hypothetical protein
MHYYKYAVVNKARGRGGEAAHCEKGLQLTFFYSAACPRVHNKGQYYTTSYYINLHAYTVHTLQKVLKICIQHFSDTQIVVGVLLASNKYGL